MNMLNEFSNKNGIDLLKEQKNDSIDLILTDPPYIISKKSGMNSLFNSDTTSEKYGNKYAIQTDYGKWDSEFTLDDLNIFVNEYYRVLKKGGTIVIFFDLWKIETLKEILENNKFEKIRFIEWVKTNPVPINQKVAYLSNSREVALFATKGSGNTFNSTYDNGIYLYPIYQGNRKIDRIHPTQKSLELFQDIIKKHTNEGDIVLDTFGGSATTYIASLKENRKCKSCELNKDYYEKSLNRIDYHFNKNLEKFTI
jgi:site-specific DNA-methyltransferase (adenine-specific)